MSNISHFSHIVTRCPLRPYQLEPAHAILESINKGLGMTFVVEIARQGGKNELSGQLEAYLLNLYHHRGGQIVKASPTFKPQTLNSIIRLTERLDNIWNQGLWRKREGFMVEMGKARTLFFSGEKNTNVVGATADILLECDEAQAITEMKWGKDFEPMGASTNVTTVLYGTAWTSKTMLATTTKHLKRLEAKDGRRRVFKYDADVVGAQVPAYARYVAARVKKLGRNHPLIKTQYYLEEIDATGGLFDKLRRALMRGDHERQTEPTPGKRYALLIDVAGEDEQAGDAITREMLENKRRDTTALTVVEVATRYGELPTYRTIDRRIWLGTKHTALHGKILALARHWSAPWIVIDATGIGHGLAAFLAKALPDRTIPIIFSQKTKSEIGWEFVGIVETGRYRDYADDGKQETLQFWHEVQQCKYEVGAGPGRTLKWGVWDSVAYDGLIAHGHDDLLISAALTAVLDKLEWPETGPSGTVEMPDEMEAIDGAEWS